MQTRFRRCYLPFASFLPDERNDENLPGRRDTAGQLLSSSLCRRPPRRVAQLLSTLQTVVVCGGELVFALSLLHSISLSVYCRISSQLSINIYHGKQLTFFYFSTMSAHWWAILTRLLLFAEHLHNSPSLCLCLMVCPYQIWARHSGCRLFPCSRPGPPSLAQGQTDGGEDKASPAVRLLPQTLEKMKRLQRR